MRTESDINGQKDESPQNNIQSITVVVEKLSTLLNAVQKFVIAIACLIWVLLLVLSQFSLLLVICTTILILVTVQLLYQIFPS